MRKSGDISSPDLIISLPFSCEEIIVKWDLLSFENLDHEIVTKNRLDIQMFDVSKMSLDTNDLLSLDDDNNE